MQEKYGKDGVVCISVCVDPADKRATALDFLKQQNARMANYWLDEPDSLWQDRLDINGPPALFIFDREGDRVGKFDSSEDYNDGDVENLVKKTLQQR